MDALATYRKVDTYGKTQLDLVIKVYDGALDAYRRAKDSYLAADTQQGYEQLEAAKKFLVHLYTTLDFEKGGEVAQQLGQLYTFCINETNVIQATKETTRIDDIINVLNNLREGWAGLRRQQSAPGPTPTGPQEKKAAGGGKFETSA